MDKKPLIGVSICAVVLLVLGSLSNVVGYSSVKSTVNDSPLFATRTQRATNQQQNIITSKYLGMDKGSLLQFPIRDNITEQFKNAIDIISKMDDKTFDEFVNRFISLFHQNNINNVKVSDTEIKEIFYQIKSNPNALRDFYIMMKEKDRLERTFQNICLLGIILVTIFICPFMMAYAIFTYILNILGKIYDYVSMKICSPWDSINVCHI
jgi:hypothetical protein